ncbi:hypothetical protein F0P96_17900 [Hymenobacter busanensis]|uniref:Uncharacterized protein n=1 Tax=Hymenobacter busanensis TaxID=2607656 RepID=A0A7L4ZS02_9BACT|nr:hypothetical protein [Hymenobacter busanensis]KAA9327113.1 hypothetical protein F0P96_17900 [Hymenobacter busanensis]QHJ05778.1 hypothetical protein GUY19_00100 [Hymenobacter busanensis]
MSFEWTAFDGGKTIGMAGSEEGLIRLDEELVNAARITLEQGGFAPFSITLGIYGLMFHTIFCSNEPAAREMVRTAKLRIARILSLTRNQEELQQRLVEELAQL